MLLHFAACQSPVRTREPPGAEAWLVLAQPAVGSLQGANVELESVQLPEADRSAAAESFRASGAPALTAASLKDALDALDTPESSHTFQLGAGGLSDVDSASPAVAPQSMLQLPRLVELQY